jgi:glyceraldehyde 3-phosphate dehydrogenase
MKKLRIGINGFGRIGRAFVRLNLKHQNFEIVQINDIEEDLNNLAYLLKYDTVYGKLMNISVSVEGEYLNIDQQRIQCTAFSRIEDVNWSLNNVDVVIDASGVLSNAISSRKCLTGSVRKVIISHAPKEGVDYTYMYGVNDDLYKPNDHNVISSSICDANAVAPFCKCINETFGIEMAQITTLHPWLSYQNLMDGTLKSVSSPGHTWNDYALGRSSIGSLIPKDTTLTKALSAVIPDISKSVQSISFRVPTSIVSSAEGSILLKSETNIDDVTNALLAYSIKNEGVLKLNGRSLVSIDYVGEEFGAVVDTRWLSLLNGKMLKFVLWYDNEMGYTSRIYQMINKLLQ